MSRGQDRCRDPAAGSKRYQALASMSVHRQIQGALVSAAAPLVDAPLQAAKNPIGIVTGPRELIAAQL